jgi:hypothetical protein
MQDKNLTTEIAEHAEEKTAKSIMPKENGKSGPFPTILGRPKVPSGSQEMISALSACS